PTGEEQVILPDQMLGIRPDWLRMHRKAQRPAMGAFRAATMHQYFSAINFLPVSDAMSSIVSSCVPRGDLTAAMLGRARSDSAAWHRPKQKPVSAGTRFRQPRLLLASLRPSRA